MRPGPAVARLCAYLGVALLAVAAWLSGRPIVTTDRQALEEWLLVDVSDSMRLARRDFAAQLDQLLENAARRQAGAGSAQEEREFRWIAFGNGVREQRGPSASGALSSIDGSASDLAQALELVEARMAEQGRVRLRIWSDGGFTGADPGAVLERLAREGVGIEWLEVPPRDAPELYLADVRAPFEAAPGERVVLRVSLTAFGEGSARVRYGFRGGAALQRELALGAGGPHEFELVAGEMGARADELFVELEGRARERWRAPIRLRAERNALHIGGAALSRSLNWIDAAPAEALATLDLLVTSRSGPAHSELEAIEPFVARGGTWLQFATPERGLEAGPLTALEPRMPGNPGQDWVVLLDGSGSMRGERWARLLGAWARVERLLPAGTRIEKRIFAAEIGPALAELPPDAPGGPTALVESLERWSQAGTAQSPLADGRALLVISDGEDRLGAAALSRANALRQRWQGELFGIAVSPAGVARPAVLAALAGSADRVLDAGNLLEEGAEQRLFETLRGVLERRLWQVEPRKLRASTLTAAMHISARVVAGAQLLVELEDGSPLVAERAHGLGRVISIACPPGAVQGADRERWLASWCQVRSAPAPRLVLNSGALVLEDAGSLEANGGLELAGTLLSWVERDGSRMRVPISRLPGGRVGWSFEAQWPARSAEQGPELLRPGAPALALAWPQSWSPESRPDRRELAPQALRPVPAREREGRDPRGPLVVGFLLLGLVALGLAAWGGFFHTSGAGVQARGGLFRSKSP